MHALLALLLVLAVASAADARESSERAQPRNLAPSIREPGGDVPQKPQSAVPAPQASIVIFAPILNAPDPVAIVQQLRELVANVRPATVAVAAPSFAASAPMSAPWILNRPSEAGT